MERTLGSLCRPLASCLCAWWCRDVVRGTCTEAGCAGCVVIMSRDGAVHFGIIEVDVDRGKPRPGRVRLLAQPGRVRRHSSAPAICSLRSRPTLRLAPAHRLVAYHRSAD